MQAKKVWLTIGICLLSLTVLATSVVLARRASLVLSNEYTLKVSYTGDRELTLEYGQSYEQPEITASFYGSRLQTQPVDVPVTISGQVDTGRLGTYMQKYIAQYNGCEGTAYRRVHVVDTQAPVITLTVNPEKVTLPGETYEEEGFTATDNHDGDVTHLVKRDVSKSKIVYTVSDTSGNVTTVERVIVYEDPEPPVLKLKGKDAITLRVGQSYQEPGYSAEDNCDGNLTGKVTVSGSVDTSKSGIYCLTYSVSDSRGNKTTKYRTVSVLSESTVTPPSVVYPAGKTIYLTFDDGPSAHTGRLLDVLKKYNVKATFFVVNRPSYYSLVKRAHQEGHTVAIHAKSHTYKKIYASPQAYYTDLYAMQEIIKNLTGETTTMFRFPGGSSNRVSKKYCKGIMTFLTQELVNKGFQFFDWNVDSNDAGGAKTADKVFQNVISGVSKQNYSVVLQHDTKGYSVDAVERIIVWGLENGYTFRALEPNSPGCHHHLNN